MLITIREVAQTTENPATFSAELRFDNGPATPITITDPFDQAAEQRVEWYYEQWLEMPMISMEQAEETAKSLHAYGETLFKQLFADQKLYARYYAALGNRQPIAFEISGSPRFHKLHWEVLRDPDKTTPFAIEAELIRKDEQSQTWQGEPQTSDQLNQTYQLPAVALNALQSGEQLGTDHLDIAESLNNLGRLLFLMWRYEEARPYLECALAIKEKQWGSDHPNLLQTLDNLGALRQSQSMKRYGTSLNDYQLARGMGHDEQAQLYLERALAIREKQWGPEHPNLIQNLNNLGALHQSKTRYQHAISYYERVLGIREQLLGIEHLDTAESLYKVGKQFHRMAWEGNARPYYEQVLAIREKLLGTEHLDTAQILFDLGDLFYLIGDDETISYFKRVLAIEERQLGPEHPKTIDTINFLAELFYLEEQNEESMLYCERALAVMEKQLGPEHLDIEKMLSRRGYLFLGVENEKAWFCYKRILTNKQKLLGPEHPYIATMLHYLGIILSDMDRHEEARPYFEQALTIWEKQVEAKHPDTATSLEDLYSSWSPEGWHHKQARPYFEQVLAIMEKQLGPDHSSTKTVREKLAVAL